MLLALPRTGLAFIFGFSIRFFSIEASTSPNNVIIHAIQKDWYYWFLVPLTLPILVVAVYFHWLSMKLFKHA